MAKLYRRKTETEKALHAIKLWGMSPVKLQYTFGGIASEWGRILKGRHQARGEYLAVLKEINTYGYKAVVTWAAAKKKGYGKRTRKGGIVPRTRSVISDIQAFYEEQIFERQLVIDEVYYDDPGDVYDRFVDFYSEGRIFRNRMKK
jgi:hypothetical protein